MRVRLKTKLVLAISGMVVAIVATFSTIYISRTVRQALNDLQLALETETFMPSTAERRFALAVNNYAAVVMAAPIVAACRALAPRIRLSLRPSG